MSDPQLALDFTPRARRTDPATSKAAARRVDEFAAHLCARIVLALKDHGPMTVHQISLRTGLQEQQCNKRTPELERAQAIALTGETRPGGSGRMQRVWKACT